MVGLEAIGPHHWQPSCVRLVAQLCPLFAAPWTVALQVPLPMEISKQ